MTYIAIETRFLGPTNHRGARIKAVAMDRLYSNERPDSTTVAWDDSKDTDGNHEAAAWALLPKVCSAPDRAKLHRGATERGFVYVVVTHQEVDNASI